MKTGLVLEGGAMRGMYTAGVLDIFLDHHILVDCAVGVSAGALFGVNYLSGQKGRVIRYSKRFNPDKNYLGILPLLNEGNIVSTKYAYEEVPRKLDPFDDESYKKSGIPFYAVATNIETANPEYMQIKSVFTQMDMLRASGSMPFVSQPVEINGQKYLDGAISDSIPFEWLLNQGCEKLIVVLTRDINYRKKPMSPALIKLYARKYPQIAKRLLERHTLYNHSVEKLLQLEEAEKAFVIRPSKPIEIGRIEKNPAKLQKVYELGLSDANTNLMKLQDFLRQL
ncbi:patatin-like phospholipase family protein [Anaerostipes faecalis]|uniref:patatin-like phospholipase family protein n=1 Tax=Anaerostipes faecalis TaxID=2738446 RepID=UPI003F06B0CE